MGRASRQYYPNNQVFDLREQLSDLLYGDENNPGIGQKMLVRRLSDKRCVCWDDLRGSPDSSCRYCQGEGFLWVETMNVGYIARNFGSVQNPANVIARESMVSPIGITDENRALGFFEAKAFPNYERYLIPTIPKTDKLYELKVDGNGRLVTPVLRTKKWEIRSVTPHRGDNGAVQFCELGLNSEYV